MTAFEESDVMRSVLMAMAMSKKSDRIYQKLQQNFYIAFKDWDKALHEYVQVTFELKKLIEIAEQQDKIVSLRRQLKQYSEMIKSTGQQFNLMINIFNAMLPVSSIGSEWLEAVIKHDQLLSEIRETLASVLVFSNNREVIESIQVMTLQINDIQTRLTVLADMLKNGTEKILSHGSNAMRSVGSINKLW